MNQANLYDVIIIGAGPIGIACALACNKNNLHYLVIEKGCLVNSLYNYPQNMTFFSTSEKLEIGNIPFVCTNAKPTRNEALEYYRRVAKVTNLNVHLFEEVITVSDQQNNSYIVETTKGNYLSKHIIISTGFHDIPYLLNIPGENLPKVTHYYKDPHFYAFQNIIVVGANNSAVDAALETWRKAANVTMIIQNDAIGSRVKYWARPDIINRIEEGSIRAYYNSTIKEIKETSVIINTPQGIIDIPNDWVIAATGYQPNLNFLEKIGIDLSDDTIKKPYYDEHTHESNKKGIYLAGVICGGMNTHSLFIENSIEHANKIVMAIMKN
ncbi:MAG: YpdA family putative bacillithiol disulfide reductase [Sediminibacterium sp.]